MSYPSRIAHFTADEVAECLPYRQFLSPEQDRALYAKLWGFLNESNNRTPLGGDGTNGTVEYPEERMSARFTDKVPHWWDKLLEYEKEAIIKAVEKEYN